MAWIGRAGYALLRLRWWACDRLTPRREVRSRGLRFTLQSDNWITHYRWATYDTKEPETLDWIDHDVRDGDVLFDVGANIGVYSLYAALRHPGVTVVAFEPEYSNLHLLRDNVVANGLAARIRMYAIALGDRSGLSQLLVQDLTPGAALHTESAAGGERTRAGLPVVLAEGIAVTTLDRFCDEAGLRPNAVKIDVDGTEVEILRGALSTLGDRALRTIVLEMPAAEADAATCRTLLGSAGFTPREAVRTRASRNEVWMRPPEVS